MNKDKDFILQLQAGQCVSCGICAESCAYGAIRMGDFPEVDEENCRLCGACVQACPVGAWVMQRQDERQEQPVDDSNGIWVWAEVMDGALAPVSRELLGKAVALAACRPQPVEAVLIGGEVAAWADELIAAGADRVHVVESPLLSDFVEENYTEVWAGLVRKQHPSVLLIGATPCGRGLSARLAAVLHTGLTADCTELEMDTDSGLLRQIRPAFGGNLMATIVNPVCRPQMASVRPGVMKARQKDTSRRREIVYHAYEAGRADSRVRVLETVAEEVGGTSLNDSSIIIGRLIAESNPNYVPFTYDNITLEIPTNYLLSLNLKDNEVLMVSIVPGSGKEVTLAVRAAGKVLTNIPNSRLTWKQENKMRTIDKTGVYKPPGSAKQNLPVKRNRVPRLVIIGAIMLVLISTGCFVYHKKERKH